MPGRGTRIVRGWTFVVDAGGIAHAGWPTTQLLPTGTLNTARRRRQRRARDHRRQPPRARRHLPGELYPSLLRNGYLLKVWMPAYKQSDRRRAVKRGSTPITHGVSVT